MRSGSDKVIRHRAVEHRAVEVGGRRARQEVMYIDRQVRRLRAYLAQQDRALDLEDHGLHNDPYPDHRLYREVWAVRYTCGDAEAHRREGHKDHTWDIVEATLRIRASKTGYHIAVEVDPYGSGTDINGSRSYAKVSGHRADAVWRRIQRALDKADNEKRRQRLAARTFAELQGSQALAEVLGGKYEGKHWLASRESNGVYTIAMTHAFSCGALGLPNGRELLKRAGWKPQGGGVLGINYGSEIWAPPTEGGGDNAG